MGVNIGGGIMNLTDRILAKDYPMNISSDINNKSNLSNSKVDDRLITVALSRLYIETNTVR